MSSSEKKVVCETPTPGKKPTRIDKWKYDLISKSILEILPATGDGLLFKNLPKMVSEKIDKETKSKLGSVSWYTTTVKLDLECKNLIHRVDRKSPQRLLKNN